MERDFIPYNSAELPANARVLVLAPHPDDEVLGCGGALALHAEAGHPVNVLILTDGAAADPQNKDIETYRRTREQESKLASLVLGYSAPEFLCAPDRGLANLQALVGIIDQRIKELSISHLYCPSPSEIHPDHFAAAMFGLEAGRLNPGVQLMFYEVGVPLQPNLLLDITTVAEKKQKAIECFQSQLTIQSYDQHIAGLNRFRSYTLGKKVTQVEAYRCISGSELYDWSAIFGRSRLTDIMLTQHKENHQKESAPQPMELLEEC